MIVLVIDSYCNLLMNPIVYNVIASIPANGPRPTTMTNKIAHNIEGNVLVAAKSARSGA